MSRDYYKQDLLRLLIEGETVVRDLSILECYRDLYIKLTYDGKIKLIKKSSFKEVDHDY